MQKERRGRFPKERKRKGGLEWIGYKVADMSRNLRTWVQTAFSFAKEKNRGKERHNAISGKRKSQQEHHL